MSPSQTVRVHVHDATQGAIRSWVDNSCATMWTAIALSIDLCVVPTLSWRVLFAFVVVDHGRRQLLWFASDPASEGGVAGPNRSLRHSRWNAAPAYLVRDNG